MSALAAQLDLYSATLDPDNRLSTVEKETAVESALLKVVRRIRDYDPTRATLLTWARGFVRNEMREVLRNRKETPVGDGLATHLADTQERDQRAQALAAGTEPSEEEIAVLALLLQLKPGNAELLYAHAVEGLTFQAIADRLDTGVTEAALRKRYQRARNIVVDNARNDAILQHLTEANPR